MNERTVTIERILNAPRDKVWRAWTDPAELAKWWGPKGVTNPECTIDLKVGGTIYVVMLAGKELGPMAGQRWPMKGTFKEIVPPDPSNPRGQARLVFENNAVAEDGTVMLEGESTVLLEDVSNGPSTGLGTSKTKLTLIAYAKGMVPQAPQMLAGMEMGWTQSIDKLAKLVAAG